MAIRRPGSSSGRQPGPAASMIAPTSWPRIRGNCAAARRRRQRAVEVVVVRAAQPDRVGRDEQLAVAQVAGLGDVVDHHRVGAGGHRGAHIWSLRVARPSVTRAACSISSAPGQVGVLELRAERDRRERGADALDRRVERSRTRRPGPRRRSRRRSRRGRPPRGRRRAGSCARPSRRSRRGPAGPACAGR